LCLTAVSNVSAVGVNASSIFVKWTPSKGSLVSGYNVSYRMASGGSTLHVVFQRNFSRVYLLHLRGMTTYGIKVGLIKNQSVTFWSDEVFGKTLLGGKQYVMSWRTSFSKFVI